MNQSAETLIEDVEYQRAEIYSLMGRLLAGPPPQETLQQLGAMTGEAGAFGEAIAALATAARQTDPHAVDEEYHQLFIGLGRGELVPFASYYLTGFLHEKPLARLRNDLRALGIERDPAVKEPEDHVVALMQVMAGLILGRFGTPGGLAQQQRFFDDHLAPWARHFFRDLETAEAARFYRPVGRLGSLLMEIEGAAFVMT